MKHLFSLTFILFICFQSNLNAQIDAYADEESNEIENQIRYEDYIYQDYIKTPQLFVRGDQMNYPVLFLGDGKRLELHFDDFTREFQTYSYDIIHCNANWEPSGLVRQEYIDGFFNGYIEDYKYSFNTLFPYIHYRLTFPNEEIRFKISGNYILKVFSNTGEEVLLFTKRFFVVEPKVTIKASIKMATLAKYRDYKQEVDFSIWHQNYTIQDPYSDIQVVISKNRRWDNAIYNLKPLFVKTPELVYNYERENLFNGGNEYRFFDAKELRYQSMNVDGIQIIGGKTNLYVLKEEPRSFKQYYFQNDLNGKRFIKRDDSQDSHVEADYIKTFFTLGRETEVTEGDVYVFGELSDWQFKEEFKMEYVEVSNEYRAEVLLKQGYYNYSYIVLPKGSSVGDLSYIEGTHSDTENDYYFFVYHRQRGEIYDRLIGFKTINTAGDTN